MPEKIFKTISIKSVITDEQIVFGEVYAPDVLDYQGEYMPAEDIRKMAHKFMYLDGSSTIDVMHDNNPINAHPVESFIARKNDSDYREGAWVLGVKINDDVVWESIKSGELGGFSFQAFVNKETTIAEITYKVEELITTEPHPDDGHVHYAYINLDDSGKIISGKTSETNNHSHDISHGTTTNESDKHLHRIIL